MSATYNEMLKRLIEERKRLGLSQQQMARLVHITQSNYSKVEKGLHRLSYEELKYLSKANIDIFYIFTGYRCAGMQIPLHRITDSASNGSVFPVVTEHFSASSDHAFL